MIYGIGMDLCEIGRIQKALERWGERFAHKILVESEMQRFHRHRRPAAFLAKRFAAKEAFSKAVGRGIRHPVSWHTITVVNAASGKPSLQFTPALEAWLKERGIGAVHVSITDEINMAAAYVIAEAAEEPQ
jgi:holo-[acyl-carrier protein] synthase